MNDKSTLLVGNSAGDSAMTNLFQVTTIVKEFSGHRNVRFDWFCAERKEPPIPYAKAIRDYDPHDDDARYSEFAIDELFTRDEAKALKAYLDKHHGNEGVTTIEQYDKLPIDMNTIGFGVLSMIHGGDYCSLWEEPGYSLPFHAEGYFDLRDAECIDGRENVAHPSGRLAVYYNEGERKEAITSSTDLIIRLFDEHLDWTTMTLERADGSVIGRITREHAPAAASFGLNNRDEA